MEYLILRSVSSVLAGMIMSQAGSLLQISTRNILASPSTLGFDGLSILWVLCFHSLLVYLNLELPLSLMLLSGGFVFLLVGLIYSKFMAKYERVEKLILMGLTFNLLVGAVFSLWQFLFVAFNLPFPVELWFGHFRYAGSESTLVLGFIEFIILGGWFYFRRSFGLYTMGSNVSVILNLNQENLYRFMFISISLGTFIVVGLFGAFSFLGLIFPVIARKFWFKKYDLAGELLLGSFVNGFFLMAIDNICYFFPVYGAEIPVGLIATGIGALSLIYLLWKSDNRLEILAKR
jgi:iron complex transport system permease protein